jgi:type II secretory pathway component PulC
MKAKRKLTYLLSAGTALIWGIVIFRAVSLLSQDAVIYTYKNTEIDRGAIVRSGSAMRRDTLFASIPSDRDPFQFRKTVPVKKNVDAEEKKVSIPVPSPSLSYVISGVIVGEHDRLVVLDDKDENKQVFLRINQDYKNISIIEIRPDTITIVENGKRRKIGL